MVGKRHSLSVLLLLIQLCQVLSDPDECLEHEFEAEPEKCIPCRECGPGQELSKECGYGEGGDAHCVACSSRRYKKNWGHNRCIPCLSCGLINRIQKSICTAHADTVCGECLPGFYSKTRIGGLKEQECIPCTRHTSPAETQCNHIFGPIKLESSAAPPRDMTALLVGASSAVAITALAVVILSIVYCRRFFKSQCRRVFLSAPKFLEPRVTFSSCESQSKSPHEERPPKNPCCMGNNIPNCQQNIQGPVEEFPSTSDSQTSSLQSCNLPCTLQPGTECSQSSLPATEPQLMRRISETQPLIRNSGCSDCSTGCSSSDTRRSPTGALETLTHHPMSATLSCASEQAEQRWSHAPVECTELDLQKFSMEPEFLGTADQTGPVHHGIPEMAEQLMGPPGQPQEISDTGFQHFNIENGVNEFQSLVLRICSATQGLRLGQLPQAVVLLLSLRLDPYLPGVKNYMDVGMELGIPRDLMSQMSGYGHLHAYLSSSSLCTIPGLIHALHRLQRFDTLSLLCEHFVQGQAQSGQHPHPC